MSQKLSGHAMEALHRSAIMPFFLRDGFVPFLPDWDEGIDFIVYREQDDLLIKVQQKARWTISKKYQNREIAIAFPYAGNWYLSPHHEMVLTARLHTNFLNTRSWDDGTYSTAKPSAVLLKQMERFQLQDDNEAVYAQCGATRVFAPFSGETSAPIKAEVRDDQLWVSLRDGRLIVTPLWWYPEVSQAEPVVQNNIVMLDAGLHWPDLDEDYSIAGMMRGSLDPRVKPHDVTIRDVDEK